MIGQEILLEKLNNYTIQTFPQSLLLIGQSGSGRHSIIKMLATKFNMEVVYIDKNVSHETLVEYTQCSINKFYIIEIDQFLESAQNQFLKFIEEPGQNVHIVLIAESEINILDTILNRCIIYHLAEYSIEQLKQIKVFNNQIIYNICKTPGQLLAIDEQSFNKTYELCKNIIIKIVQASIINTIGISTKINYQEEYDKIDFELFFKTILHVAYTEYIINNNLLALNIYNFTQQYVINLQRKILNKEMFMLNYLLNLKMEVQRYAA